METKEYLCQCTIITHYNNEYKSEVINHKTEGQAFGWFLKKNGFYARKRNGKVFGYYDRSKNMIRDIKVCLI